jgi:prepilin-type processing-associated H-X9-DG protein
LWDEDESTAGGTMHSIECHWWTANYFYANGDEQAYNRHLEGSNFAFVDGHVKWFKTLRNTSYALTMYGISLDPAYEG